MPDTAATSNTDDLRTLPGDDIRQIMWGFADRFDLQMLVQSVRQVARGPVAKLVAEGARNSHDWTERKNGILKEFDAAGITSMFVEPAYGGYLEGPKNLAMALAAFELSWVDGGAATCSLATGLALAPIHERGTPEQIEHYMRLSVPGSSGAGEEPWRGAFCLTEPIPYVGVETGLLGGRIRIAEWVDGKEPVVEVSKRGRFITNMGFANFVTAAVESDDERIKGTCMVILEEGDPGIFDRGAAGSQAGPPALIDQRSGLQPQDSGQPDHWRLYRQGRSDRTQLQPRRDHRGGFPPDPRDGRPDDRGQAALGGRAADSLPPGPVPGRRGCPSRLAAL